MAIKAGQILHVGHDSVVIDRIQTAGPGNVNIPTEKVFELGNYESVATIRDTPDLSFSLESLDVSCEIEAMLLDVVLASTTSFDLTKAKPLHLASQFKAGKETANEFLTVQSVGLPHLALEGVSYRFGLRDNARQSLTLRGSQIYYNPGSTYVQTAAGTNTANQTVVSTNPAYAVVEQGVTRRALNVSVDGKRLALGTDYTESSGAPTNGAAVVTVTLLKAVPTTSKISVMYASPTAKTYNQSVHAGVSSTRPAAVRGRDIDIYLGSFDAATPANSAANKVGQVQGVAVDYRVTLEKDEEFGNYYELANDADVPTVTGSIDLKPTDPAALLSRIRQIANVSAATEVAGPNTSVALPLHVVIKSPDTGSILKRITVPDARFTLPGFSGQVNTRLQTTLNFESDTGKITVYKDNATA